VPRVMWWLGRIEEGKRKKPLPSGGEGGNENIAERDVVECVVRVNKNYSRLETMGFTGPFGGVKAKWMGRSRGGEGGRGRGVGGGGNARGGGGGAFGPEQIKGCRCQGVKR